MNDPYTRVPWSTQPLSCDLVDIATGKIVLCRLLTWDTLKKTFPGQVETLNGTRVVIDNIGPLDFRKNFP